MTAGILGAGFDLRRARWAAGVRRAISGVHAGERGAAEGDLVAAGVLRACLNLDGVRRAGGIRQALNLAVGIGQGAEFVAGAIAVPTFRLAVVLGGAVGHQGAGFLFGDGAAASEEEDEQSREFVHAKSSSQSAYQGPQEGLRCPERDIDDQGGQGGLSFFSCQDFEGQSSLERRSNAAICGDAQLEV